MEGLQLPVCLQLDIDMITGTPSSTSGIDLYFPSKEPESILRFIFLVDLIRICHLHSLSKGPLEYSRGKEFLCFVREKYEHLMQVCDSRVGF